MIARPFPVPWLALVPAVTPRGTLPRHENGNARAVMVAVLSALALMSRQQAADPTPTISRARAQEQSDW